MEQTQQKQPNTQQEPKTAPPAIFRANKLPIEDGFVGLIIGKGGATINQIRTDTGANLSLKKPNKDISSQWVLITGTEEQVNDATQYIQKIIDRKKNPESHSRSSSDRQNSNGRYPDRRRRDNGRYSQRRAPSPPPPKPEFCLEKQQHEFPWLPTKPRLGNLQPYFDPSPSSTQQTSAQSRHPSMQTYAQKASYVEKVVVPILPAANPKMIALSSKNKKPTLVNSGVMSWNRFGQKEESIPRGEDKDYSTIVEKVDK